MRRSDQTQMVVNARDAVLLAVLNSQVARIGAHSIVSPHCIPPVCLLYHSSRPSTFFATALPESLFESQAGNTLPPNKYIPVAYVHAPRHTDPGPAHPICLGLGRGPCLVPGCSPAPASMGSRGTRRGACGRVRTHASTRTSPGWA